MRKNDLTKLDLNKWLTQQAMAQETGVSIQAVQNWISRGQIDFITLPGNTTLVNKNTLKINNKLGRPRKIVLK